MHVEGVFCVGLAVMRDDGADPVKRAQIQTVLTKFKTVCVLGKQIQIFRAGISKLVLWKFHLSI